MASVNNLAYTVPDAVRDIFYSYLPYGSDYVMFCDRYSTGVSSGITSYTMLYRRVGKDTVDSVVCSRSSSSAEWVVTTSSSSDEYDGFTVSKPYYAYSNLNGQGRYTVLPSGQNLVVLMLVICASLLVLKTVFGGIRLWRSRSSGYSVY